MDHIGYCRDRLHANGMIHIKGFALPYNVPVTHVNLHDVNPAVHKRSIPAIRSGPCTIEHLSNTASTHQTKYVSTVKLRWKTCRGDALSAPSYLFDHLSATLSSLEVCPGISGLHPLAHQEVVARKVWNQSQMQR